MTSKAKLIPVWLTALTGIVICREVVQAYDWLAPTNKVALLAVVAHPDDEGIFFGGALPYYSSVLQLPTTLVCLTHGWGSVRDDELRCAAWTYGLRYEPIFGRFRDLNTGTYTNTPYGTNTINMCWDLWADGVYQGDGSDVETGKARAINFVAEQIRRCRPDVILAQDLDGETGHDNHKAAAYAVTRAFEVAADPNATATNLVGLPPWQAQKLYLHFYPTNRLFHTAWETPYPALTNRTPREVVNLGLTCHVSQTSNRWICASVYPPGGMYYAWPSEWWGLYASMVGPDTILSSNIVVNGYTVPRGVAAGDFLANLMAFQLYFTATPQSATVSVGSSTTLSAAAVAARPPVRYQWQFNGVSIPDATAASLTLSNVQPADAGGYTVVVTNSESSITSPVAVLTVLFPPMITSPPQTRTNLAGTVASFSASADGSRPLGYQWYLNGTKLQDTGNIRGATASTLKLANVGPADAGNFVLVVTNAVGAAAATVATLVVVSPPPCVAAPTGLVGWWPGDGTAEDITGTNNGLLTGGVTIGVPGKVGNALGFDGINGRVQIPDSPQLKPAELTLEAWVLFSALDSAVAGGALPGQQYLIFKQNSRAGNFEGYCLDKSRTADGDVFSFVVSSASGQAVSLRSTTVVTTGVWYHVVAARGSDFTRLYINGQLESQTNVSFPQDYGLNDLFFGSSGQSYWDGKFSGLLDEVALYHRALSGGEIAAIYAAGAAGKCQEAAVAIQPQSLVALIGSTATLTAAASGPGLSFQWFYNETNALPGATNSVLLLTDLNVSQSGTYSILASNFAGAVLSQPAVLEVTPVRGIVMPIKLSGPVASSWRIDFVDDLRPNNNWVTLATVTLTNTSQVYFDSSALTQRHRFYRVVPVP